MSSSSVPLVLLLCPRSAAGFHSDGLFLSSFMPEFYPTPQFGSVPSTQGFFLPRASAPHGVTFAPPMHRAHSAVELHQHQQGLWTGSKPAVHRKLGCSGVCALGSPVCSCFCLLQHDLIITAEQQRSEA